MDESTLKHDRHDFKKPVKDALEKQVCSQCSNPDCRQPTRASSYDNARVINIGTAAHIQAASPGGPRYNATITQSDREAAENGIWLCRNCATLVDDDCGGFPISLLQLWKQTAIDRARSVLVSPISRLSAAAIPSIEHETSESKERDRSRYEEFLKDYSTRGGVMVALRQFSGKSRIQKNAFDKLERLGDIWLAPENAFSNPAIQSALRSLTKAIGSFLDEIMRSMFTCQSVGILAVPSEWMGTMPERYYTTVKLLDDLALKIEEAHANFILVAREQLDI